VRSELPATRVLVYSGTCCPMQASRILQMKPHGFIEKGDSLQTLRDALRAVSAGGCYFAASASPLLMRGASLEHQELSEREIEVLQMVAEGKSSKEIANILARAVKTVENHRAHIMEKLHVHDVAGLTRYATRRGLVR
jgi:DNA-binding NarL/FixJ family response regulator